MTVRRAKKEVQEQHDMEVKGLQGHVAELDKENRELRDNKYALNSRVSEMSHKLGSSEGQVKTLSAEVSRLQAQFQTVSRCSLSPCLVSMEHHVCVAYGQLPMCAALA